LKGKVKLRISPKKVTNMPSKLFVVFKNVVSLDKIMGNIKSEAEIYNVKQY